MLLPSARPLTNGLEIKPGQTVEFKPESFHIMFVGLKHPLAAGNIWLRRTAS